MPVASSATLGEYVETTGAWVGTLATFGTPDLRGEFLRGLDDGRGVDTGRALGSAQAGMVEAHTHTAGNPANQGNGYNLSGGNPGTPPGAVASSSYGGAETRPRNVALLGCIKY